MNTNETQLKRMGYEESFDKCFQAILDLWKRFWKLCFPLTIVVLEWDP